MIIFKIALIILVAFPVIYFAWYEFRKVLRHVRDLNNREKAERKRKEAIAAAARESEPEPVSSRYAQSARTRYEDPMFTQPQNEYADPRYTQQMQSGYTQQMQSGYIEPMEEDFQPATKQAYEDQYVEPVRKKKTTRRRKNGRR